MASLPFVKVLNRVQKTSTVVSNSERKYGFSVPKVLHHAPGIGMGGESREKGNSIGLFVPCHSRLKGPHKDLLQLSVYCYPLIHPAYRGRITLAQKYYTFGGDLRPS